MSVLKNIKSLNNLIKGMPEKGTILNKDTFKNGLIGKLNYVGIYKPGESIITNNMKTKQQDILTSSVNELRFAMLQILHLKNTLQEIEEMTSDVLTKEVVKNGLARHELDKLIHTRNLFTEK